MIDIGNLMKHQLVKMIYLLNFKIIKQYGDVEQQVLK